VTGATLIVRYANAYLYRICYESDIAINSKFFLKNSRQPKQM